MQPSFSCYCLASSRLFLWMEEFLSTHKICISLPPTPTEAQNVSPKWAAAAEICLWLTQACKFYSIVISFLNRWLMPFKESYYRFSPWKYIHNAWLEWLTADSIGFQILVHIVCSEASKHSSVAQLKHSLTVL